MISSDALDLPFSQNQPVKSDGDWYIRILKNILENLGRLTLTEKKSRRFDIVINWVSE